MSKNIILGAGISGLIFSFFNPDFKILTKDVGGQNKNPLPMGVRLLHKNKWNKRLLKKLGIKAKVKTAKIGYWVDCGVENKASRRFRHIYWQVSRQGRGKPNESYLSGGKDKLKYYDVNMGEIIKKLHEACENRIEFIGKRKFDLTKYDLIINTIPANVFFKIAGIKHNFEFLPKTFVYAKNFTPQIIPISLEKYSYVYCAMLGSQLTRISRTKNVFCLEYAGILKNKVWQEIERMVLSVGQIITQKPPYPDNVIPIGRYAEWNDDLLIQDVVKKAIKWRKE